MARRLRPGDVLEVCVSNGFAYVVYVGKHADYGDAVSVHPATYATRPSLTEALSEENYVTFYPAGAAVAQDLASVVGRLTAPPMPPVFRRAGVRSGSAVETWVIESESGEALRHELTEEERRLPIAAIWNHALLVERISARWNPVTAG